ncbi:hypothetical protein GCM10022222_84390 [Amycolatopsis ultiminotia]|uniref:Chromosome partitioning protein, ParB family n=1 Tax=Amycolatopsis ultiminotia TaxID=543629 RepID=A0ABP6YSP3_9PSEU
MTSTMDKSAQPDHEDPAGAANLPTGTAPAQADPADEPDVAADTGRAGEAGEDASTASEPNADEARRHLLHDREAEYDTIVWADPDEVVIAENVRVDNATADATTTANLKALGVRVATNGYRADDGTIMITQGQRRVLNARRAGVPVPVWMQAPPPADERKAAIERIVGQMSENDVRVAMTLADTYRGMQQLAAFDLTPKAIARKLARGKGGTTYVENVFTAGASELATKAAERYDLDLVQAATIAEFDNAGDTSTATDLLRLALEQPNNFEVYANVKRTERADAARKEQLTEQLTHDLTGAGIVIFDRTLDPYSGPARTLDRLRPTPDATSDTALIPAGHASCPGHGAWIEEDTSDDGETVMVAVYGCRDFVAHGHALQHAPAGCADFTPAAVAAAETPPTEQEFEAAADAAAQAERTRRSTSIIRRWVIANNKDWDGAVVKRRKWLGEVFAQRSTAPTGSHVFLALHKANSTKALQYVLERGHDLARELLGLQPGYTHSTDLADKIAAAKPSKATVYDVFLTLCAMEQRIARNAWRNPTPEDQDYLRVLTRWGYKASDVELKVLDPEREDDVIAAALGDPAPAAQPHQAEEGSDDEDSEGDTEEDGPHGTEHGEEPVEDPRPESSGDTHHDAAEFDANSTEDSEPDDPTDLEVVSAA